MAVTITTGKVSNAVSAFLELGKKSSILQFTPLYPGDILRMRIVTEDGKSVEVTEDTDITVYQRDATFKSRDNKDVQRTFDQYMFEVIRGGDVVACVRKGFRELFVRQPVSQEDGFQYTDGDITAFFNPSVNDLIATGYYDGCWTDKDVIRHLFTHGLEIKRIIRPTNVESWNLKGRVFVLGLTCEFREKSTATSV